MQLNRRGGRLQGLGQSLMHGNYGGNNVDVVPRHVSFNGNHAGGRARGLGALGRPISVSRMLGAQGES